jgi:hypothetical protein
MNIKYNRLSPNLSQVRLNFVMNLSLISGASGTLWLILCSPQPIFIVFFQNRLGASSSLLGLLMTVIQLSAIFNLVSIPIYAGLKKKKAFWLLCHLIHRLNGFFLAAIALWAAESTDPAKSARLIIGVMTVSWFLMNISASGWWGWIADLIPEKKRAAFFGRRSAVANVINIISFFIITVLLDSFAQNRIFYLYAVLFFLGGIGGMIDILLHLFVPETVSKDDMIPILKKHFFEPIRNKNFLLFSFSIGAAIFSINIAAPFIPPFITSPDTLGAPNTWLGIMFVISQLTWIVVSRPTGIIMDRFGRKPVVIIGALFPLSWIGYFFIGPGNYIYLLPAISLAGGLLSPAFYDGLSQMMLTLTPKKNRIAFVAWFWSIVGAVSSGGSLLGGILNDSLKYVSIDTGFITITGFKIVLAVSIVLITMSALFLSRISEGRVKDVGFVVSRITNPGIFRTFLNMEVISKTASTEKALKALRSIDGSKGDIALEEVLERLDDPNPEIREEAAKALGRIGAEDAAQALIDRLKDSHSTIRIQAAQALGRIGNPAAIPALMEGINSPSEELQEACIQALGKIGGDQSTETLISIFKRAGSDRIFASGAEAVSSMGIFEAAWEIVPRMHQTANPVLRNQLSIALGNILGTPGEFYQYLTGSSLQREQKTQKLIQDTQRNVAALIKKTKDSPDNKQQLKLLLRLLKKTEENFLEDRFQEAFDSLYEFSKIFLAAIIPGNQKEDLTETAAFLEPKLGLWYWFIKTTRTQYEQNMNPISLKIDVMLGFYFLSRFKRRRKNTD